MKILILASNPRNDLKLVHEIRDLKNVIETSHNRQHFEVEDALAVRVGDLQDLLLKNRPLYIFVDMAAVSRGWYLRVMMGESNGCGRRLCLICSDYFPKMLNVFC
jgi:hypothetical protein